VRKLLWAGVLLGGLLLLFLAGLLFIDWRDKTTDPSGPVIPAYEQFRIGVLGDAQKGLANLRNIHRAVLKENVSLMLQTGDLVANNDEGHYRLAQIFLRRGGSELIPCVAPGNHDIKGGSERFVRWFGPLEKTFTDRGVAFVILNNALGGPPDPQHIEKKLREAGPHQAVILAMHQPPFDLQGNPKPDYAGFLAWLEKSKVDYLLCGHVHGYIRKKVGDTTVIINGVGGDYDKWQLDQKVYATILDVDEKFGITDRQIELEPVHEVWENLEHLAIGHLGEAYRQKPFLCWPATALLGAGVAWGVRLLRRPENPTPA
jgi:predicted MPP superfamily phosphohydrolase